MPFTETELQTIQRELEPLCEMVPEAVRDRLRMGYDVERLSVGQMPLAFA